MLGILVTLFSWPNGIVVGNLLASAIWATPALIHLHRKLDRHHAEHLAAVAGGEVSRETSRNHEPALLYQDGVAAEVGPPLPLAEDPLAETPAQQFARRLGAVEAHLVDLEERLQQGSNANA